MSQTLSVPDAPVLKDITNADLLADPYPVYRRARELGPVVKIAAANLLLVTRFDDILAIERDPETFSSVIPESNVVRLFGDNLMRKDGDDHRRERKAIETSLKPGAVKRCWAPRLERIVDEVLDEIAGERRVDLFASVAEPISGRALAAVLGFADVDWRTIARWSQAMMDGSANYAGNPEPRRRALEAAAEIEQAVDRNIDRDQESVLASMRLAGLSRGEIYGNVKVAVGGGFNEPRDSLLSLVLGLLSEPEQLAKVRADATLWPAAFEEAVRWIAPIGMYPRKLTRDARIGDVEISAGTLIGLSVAAANREPERFADPDRYSLARPKTPHLAFGSGPHFCAGTWVARMLVGNLAAPRLFARYPNLRLAEQSVPVRGWVFRGPTRLVVEWD